jgi:hypothetical protein
VETERPPRLDAINSFLPPIEPKFDTRTNCSRNPISRKEKKRNLGRLKEEERKGKKKGGKKLRLFHKKRAKTSGVKIFTSSTLGAALQRVEPDNPEHPAHEQPSWQQHAHGPLRQAGARPQTLAGPGTKSPAEVGFLREKGANSTGGEQSSSTHGGIAADPGWGSGKELDLMGQGGGLGERERERERGRGGGEREEEEEVRTAAGFLFLFCLDKRLRGFLTPFSLPFGVFGWVLFGYVLCLLLPLAFSLPLWGRCLLPLSLSPLRKGMERDLVSKLRARTGRFVDIWSLYSLSPLLILAHFYPPISTLPTHSSPE